MGLLQGLPQVAYPILPEFHGMDFENPVRFLEEMEEYFAAIRAPVNIQTFLAGRSLKGEALRWWETYKNLAVTWDRFRELL